MVLGRSPGGPCRWARRAGGADPVAEPAGTPEASGRAEGARKRTTVLSGVLGRDAEPAEVVALDRVAADELPRLVVIQRGCRHQLLRDLTRVRERRLGV